MEQQAKHFIPFTQHIEPRPVHNPLRFIDAHGAERFDHNRYFRTIRRHVYLIASALGLASILAGVRLARAPRIYTAEAKLLVTAPQPDAIMAQDTALEEGATVADPDYYKTQCDLLESRSLAERVVSKLGLYGVADRGSADGHSTPENDHEHLRQAVDTYLDGLMIKPTEEASLIGVEYRAPDPVLAAKLANAHAEVFIQQHLELLRKKQGDVADLLGQKLVDLKKRLEASELALNNYRRDQGIIPGLMSFDGKNAIVIDRLTQLSAQLTAVQVKRITLESQVELSRKGQYSSLPAVVADGMIHGLQRELDDLYTQDRALSIRYTPDYPEVVTLRAKIRGLQTQLNTEIAREVNSIELDYSAVLEQETQLESEVAKQRALTIALNDAGVKYAMLQREVDANRALYESVLKGMKDARVAADSEVSNFAIVDRAEVPEVPSSPRTRIIMGEFIVLGLFAGLGSAVLLDYLRDPLDAPEDVARLFQLPALAVIPRLPRQKGGGALEYFSLRSERALEPVIENRSSTSNFAVYGIADEGYRHLRASLLMMQHTSNYVALITSALPAEGKTQTAVNTSIMLALSGKRTLLIDGDLRRPCCHRYLGLENNEGLACILSEQRPPNNLIQPTQTKDLYFLSSGRVAFNPSELLDSRGLSATFESLRLMFEFIIIDSCPIIPISDALAIARLADGVVLVVDSNKTSKQFVRRACTRLSEARANIIGVVLNKSMADGGYYKHYYRYSAYA
jgi:succinoglycan biosynthesis transport protein ExoP